MMWQLPEGLVQMIMKSLSLKRTDIENFYNDFSDYNKDKSVKTPSVAFVAFVKNKISSQPSEQAPATPLVTKEKIADDWMTRYRNAKLEQFHPYKSWTWKTPDGKLDEKLHQLAMTIQETDKLKPKSVSILAHKHMEALEA